MMIDTLGEQDINGAALNDVVRVPWEVEHIKVDPLATEAMGGVPAAPNTRVHVHARLAIVTLRRLGLEEAASKTMIGDPIVSLGLQVDRGRRVIDCPASKRTTMLAQLSTMEESALGRPPMVNIKEAETLVGRACNLSQVFPEIVEVLHGGYTVAGAGGRVPGGGGRAIPIRAGCLRMRAGSNAHEGWLEFVRVTADLLRANVGVALAPCVQFPARMEGTTITSTTDASGVDGVGGYVFSAARPGEVWLVSEWWPPAVAAALRSMGVERSQRAEDEDAGEAGWGMLSMPAAELFGAWAVPLAAVEAGAPKGPVYAVGDCDAAVGALNAARSGTPQMRVLIRAARRLSSEWLGITLPREANGDADRLSHPGQFEAVQADAERAGLVVHRARIPPEHPAWLVLGHAIAQGGWGRRRVVWWGLRVMKGQDRLTFTRHETTPYPRGKHMGTRAHLRSFGTRVYRRPTRSSTRAGWVASCGQVLGTGVAQRCERRHAAAIGGEGRGQRAAADDGDGRQLVGGAHAIEASARRG